MDICNRKNLIKCLECKKSNKMFGMFHKKELQKSNQPEFRIE